MKVESIGRYAVPTTIHPLHALRGSTKDLQTESAVVTRGETPVALAVTTVEPVDPPTVPEGEPDEPVTEPSKNDKGVLRLLEAGHFRGVADVRLRINFFEELSARAADRAAATLEEQSQTFVSSFNDKVGELIAPLATDDASREQLDAAVAEFNAAVESATSDPSAATGGETLAATLQSAFDALVSQLRDLFAPLIVEPPPVEEPTTEEPAATDGKSTDRTTGSLDSLSAGDAPLALPEEAPSPVPADDPTAAVDDAIAALSSAFAAALADLLESFNAELQLPDPSPPHGNGRAYDKFLAIYNELRGTSFVDEAV